MKQKFWCRLAHSQGLSGLVFLLPLFWFGLCLASPGQEAGVLPEDWDSRKPDVVVVPLTSTPGAPPGGFTSRSGWPFPLTQTLPPGVTKVPEGAELFFGELPLVERSLRFVAVFPTPARQGLVFYVDQNRDGDFTNDPGGKVAGTGTFRSAANLDLTVERKDGTTFPYRVWVWTTINHPQGQEKPAFNYYGTTVKSGKAALPLPGGSRAVTISVCDSDNTGAFALDKVFIDLNGNGKIEDAEHFARESCTRYDSLIICVKEIQPYGDAVTLEFSPASGENLPIRDVKQELAREPVVGNLPPLLGKSIDGGEIQLAAFRGKVVLLDFWATWCGPCLKEMPNVRRLYQETHESGLEIIGISLDKDMGALRDFLKKEEIPWPQICEQAGWESEIAKRYHVRGIPHTVLLGKDGTIAAIGVVGSALENAVKRELSR